MIQKATELRRLVRKTGKKVRVLYTYKTESALKARHVAYLKFMQENFYPSIFTHAYVRKRSIYTNAIIHLNNDYFVKVDVSNFFPSLSHKVLVRAMYEELNRKHGNAISVEECAEIVNDCSINNIGLPLGLIISPMLSNIYMKKFDGIFYGELKKLGLKNVLYTRYADDIFVSFKTEDGSIEPSISSNAIIRLCEKELGKIKLKINRSKTKTIDLNKSNHVKIAGINLIKKEDGSRRLTVSRSTVKDLYFDAIKAYHDQDSKEDDLNANIKRIKGMQSFILSIEKTGYSHILSDKMKQSVSQLGYENLEHLVSSLGKEEASDQ